MPPELQPLVPVTATNPRKRRKPKKHGKKPNKQRRTLRIDGAAQVSKHKKPSNKLQKLYRKRAREYHSDSDSVSGDEENEDKMDLDSGEEAGEMDDDFGIGSSSGTEGEEEEEEDGGGRRGTVEKFAGGCRAFKTAFMKIMKYHLPNDDPLGPVLSAHKKLVAEKLAKEEVDLKVKGETKKNKLLASEKGHVKPANFVDSKEKHLTSVATKGVVKLFNTVNKAQNPQQGLNPSRLKGAKELANRRKETFLSEIKKPALEEPGKFSSFSSSKTCSSLMEKDDEPGWAPLRDSYMLTSPKLKDWDKMADPTGVINLGNIVESSSDEE